MPLSIFANTENLVLFWQLIFNTDYNYVLEPKKTTVKLSNTLLNGGLHRRRRFHLGDLCLVSWMRLLLATLLHRIQNCSGNLEHDDEPGDHIIFWYRCCWYSFEIIAAY